ncbi:MAG: hypothetical protein Ct9H90mP30_2060 [Actinomycetota bacterium]|nr:MAG: hypothetical protein Ct9H90mP30_2060 [Actinomycetota bacterium]
MRSASGLDGVRGSVSKVQKTTRKEIPFPRKAQAGPRTARTTPPMLGPIALAALNWVEFKVLHSSGTLEELNQLRTLAKPVRHTHYQFHRSHSQRHKSMVHAACPP